MKLRTWTCRAYSQPCTIQSSVSSASVLGGIKQGTGLSIDGSGVASVVSLTTARTISATSDISWSVSFDGSANVTADATLPNVNSNVGTFRSVTVNAKGLVTAATNPTTLSGYGITDAVDTFSNQTSIDGIKGFVKDIVVNGINAGQGLVDGLSNTAFGYSTLDAVTTGSNNTGVGYSALSLITTATENTGIGRLSLGLSVTNGYNTGVGANTLASVATGSYNVALGSRAGWHYYSAGGPTPTLTSSSNSIYLGYYSRPLANGQTNQIVIGYNGVGSGSNTVTIGNSDNAGNYFFGTLKYGTLLKPNDVAGTSGQFLGTSGTQDVWTTLTVSHISDIASTYQPLDAILTALAGLNTTSGVVIQTGTDTFTKRTLTGTTNRLTITNGDGVSGSPTFDISTSYVGQSTITTLGTITTGTWNGSVISTSYGGTGTSTAFTLGSVIFAGASGVYSQDNTNFFWDDTNNRLGIGTATPTSKLHVVGTGTIMQLASAATTSSIYQTIVNPNAGTIYLGFDSSTASTFGSGHAYATVLSSSSENALVLQTNDVNRITITGDGLVGIGTATPTERLHVSGNVRYTTLLKPNNVSGTNGQVLGTNGTQDSWVTLSTSYISDLNSYASFTNYYTESEVDTLLSGKQPTLPSGTSGQFLVKDSGGNLNFMDLKIRPIGLSLERIAVGNTDNYLGEQPYFLFKDKRHIQVSRITDSTKQFNAGMFKKSNNGFVEQIGGSLSIRATDGLYLTDFVSPSRPLSMLTIDSLGKVSVSSIAGGGQVQASLTTTHVGFGINNVLSSSSNFTFLSDRYIHFTGASSNINIGATGSGSEGFLESVNGNLLLQARSTFGVVVDDGFFKVNDLAGTGTRMVVADSTGLISTQTIPSGGGSQTIDQVLTTGNIVAEQSLIFNNTTSDYLTLNNAAGTLKGSLSLDGGLYLVSTGVGLDVIGDTALRLLSDGEINIGYSNTTGIINLQGMPFNFNEESQNHTGTASGSQWGSGFNQGAPVAGDRMLFYFDGTRWVPSHVHTYAGAGGKTYLTID